VHHRYAETTVRIDHSVAAAEPGSHGARRLTSVRLADALELGDDDNRVVRFNDPRSGWELERTVGELWREGFRVSLGPYEARVLWIDQPREQSPVPPTDAANAAKSVGAAKPRRRRVCGTTAVPPRSGPATRTTTTTKRAKPKTYRGPAASD
jgi:hypothetical protein